MRKDVILRELLKIVLQVGRCEGLTGVPFWECDGVTWWPVMEGFFFRSAITGCTLPCLALVGQETTRKWLHPIERMAVARMGRSKCPGGQAQRGFFSLRSFASLRMTIVFGLGLRNIQIAYV